MILYSTVREVSYILKKIKNDIEVSLLVIRYSVALYKIFKKNNREKKKLKRRPCTRSIITA